MFDPKALSQKSWDLTSESTPALALLKALADQGWVPGRNIDHVSLNSSLEFEVNDVMKKKTLLLCMLSLSALAEKGLQTLSTKQVSEYYGVIQNHEDPNQAPLGRDAPFSKHFAQAEVGTELAEEEGFDAEVKVSEEPYATGCVIFSDVVPGKNDLTAAMREDLAPPAPPVTKRSRKQAATDAEFIKQIFGKEPGPKRLRGGNDPQTEMTQQHAVEEPAEPTLSSTQGVIEWQRAPFRTLESGSVLPPSNAASASSSAQRYAYHPSEQYFFCRWAQDSY